MAVQKQTQAGQRIRFKAFVTIGGYNSHHVGLRIIKWSKVVATAIRGVIILTKLSTVPVQRGYWATRLASPILPCEVAGHCGSMLVQLMPVPRGTSIVFAPVPKKLLMMTSIDDRYISARGCTLPGQLCQGHL